MFKKFAIFISVLLILSSLLFTNSCNKNPFTTNPNDKLTFSTDTVHFDTVFSGIGSSTRYFVVKNSNSSQTIKIDRIFLAKQNNSKYRLNINGMPTNSVIDYEIPPGDSIFIFVEVTIDTNQDQMVESDSIIFISNGNSQDVKLISYGQDITLINGQYLRNDTTWTSEKPVLIYNSALVDTFTTLTVQAGTKVYFHRGSSLLVKGTIRVMGDPGNRVLFTGDRLEEYYNEIAGQWGLFFKDDYGNTTGVVGGIYLMPGSRFSEFHYADIKNSIIGLQIDSCVTPGIPTAILKGVNVENSKIIGLYARGAHIESENSVFANSGQYNVACIFGGEYRFIHCTFANYWIGNRRSPQLVINNYYAYKDANQNTQISYRDLKDAYFANCILYGSRENELQIDLVEGAEANFRFDNCLLKSTEYQNANESSYFIDNIFNENPKFKSVTKPYDYELDTLSAAKDNGKISVSNLVPLDRNGNSRLADGKPDLGAYERQE